MLSSIKAKYVSMSLQARAALWFTACSFLQRGITMLTTPFFTRLMDLDQYGAVNTFTAWQQVLSMICTLSLYKALMNIYCERDDWNRALSAVSSLSVLSATLWLILCLIAPDMTSKMLGMSRVLTISMFVLLAGQAVVDCWSLHQRYIYSYKKMIGITLLLTVVTSFAGLFCVIFISPTAESRVVPMAVATLVIGAVLYLGIIKEGRCFFDRSIWGFALTFCIPLLPHYLSEFVLNSSDRLMINYLCGPSEVALYSVAGSVAGLIGLVTNSINASYAPYTYQKIKAAETEQLAKTTNVVLFFVAFMLLMIELFGSEIIWIFGGEKYASSVALIAPLCFGMYFSYLFQMFARVQEYYVKRLAIVIPSVLCAIVNVVLNLALIPNVGYQAAAWTTAISYLIFCLLHYVFYRRLCVNAEIKVYDMRGVFSISIVYSAVSVVAVLLDAIPVAKYALLAILAAICIIRRDALLSATKKFIGRMR